MRKAKKRKKEHKAVTCQWDRGVFLFLKRKNSETAAERSSGRVASASSTFATPIKVIDSSIMVHKSYYKQPKMTATEKAARDAEAKAIHELLRKDAIDTPATLSTKAMVKETVKRNRRVAGGVARGGHAAGGRGRATGRGGSAAGRFGGGGGGGGGGRGGSRLLAADGDGGGRRCGGGVDPGSADINAFEAEGRRGRA